MRFFSGLEIAPTRIFPQAPYDHLKEAAVFAEMVQNNYGLSISSMQSIWYGRTKIISGSERAILLDHTKKAILFAEAVHCPNIAFGRPKSRNIPGSDMFPIAVVFFGEIGQFAHDHHTVIAIEPNLSYYGTNFINTTVAAFDFCKKVSSPGLKVNVDLGTTIHYNETMDFINGIDENITGYLFRKISCAYFGGKSMNAEKTTRALKVVNAAGVVLIVLAAVACATPIINDPENRGISILFRPLRS